jgi:hypothetical protein
VAELLAKIADGFVDGGFGAESRETRIHQAAGDVFTKGEESVHFVLGFVVKEIEEVLTLVLGRFLDEVGGIVGSEEAHIEAALPFGERDQEGRLGLGVEGEEEIVHEFAREGFEAVGALAGAEGGPLIEEFVGGVQGMRWHWRHLDCGDLRLISWLGYG